MRKPSPYAFPRLSKDDFVVVSPTNAGDMTSHPKLAKQKARAAFLIPASRSRP